MTDENSDSDDETVYVDGPDVEVSTDIRPPQDGPFSFDPLSPSLGSGEMQNGCPVKVQQSQVRDRNEILVEFGSSLRERVCVYFDVNELARAAAEAVEEAGYDLPEPEDDEE